MFDEQSIRRIIRSVLKSEREIHDKKLHGEQYRDMPPFNIVRGKTVANFTGSTGTFLLRHIVPLGQSTPYPGTEIIVVNVNKASGSANGTAYAIFHYAAEYPGTGSGAGTSSGTGTGDGNWELLVLSSGTGTASVVSDRALLIKKLGPASLYAGTDSGGINSGTRVEAAVIPLVWDNDAKQYIADRWPEDAEQGTPGNMKILPGENHCWETAIVGGAGGTGTGAEGPLLVEGHIYYETVDGTGTGTGTGTDTYLYEAYAVTGVVTSYPVVFYGEAAFASSGGPITVTPTGTVHGKMPSGNKTVDNGLEWEVDVGATVIVLRGFDEDGLRHIALNVECPEGTGSGS
jgi:hypothetical protein